MADKKISALTGASTPLAGTEVLPIVQSGATVKVAVSDLTAGRAISATSVTASTGNFVIGTAGQGIDFSINPSAPGMTSELLNDYEEGTFTPTYGGTTTDPVITYSAQNGRYVKVGSLVQVTVELETSAVVGGVGNLILKGLPFAALSNRYVGSAFVGYAVGFTTRCPRSGIVAIGASTVTLTSDTSATGQEQITTANLTNGAGQNYLIMTVVYRSA
jgi:hypothetical protein